MKRLITFLMVITLTLTMAWGAWAASGIATCSGEQSGNTAVYGGPCAITAIHMITDSSTDGKIVIHDNASAASGTVRFERTCEATSVHGCSIIWAVPKEMYNGIYVTGTGSNATYIIEYVPR